VLGRGAAGPDDDETEVTAEQVREVVGRAGRRRATGAGRPDGLLGALRRRLTT